MVERARRAVCGSVGVDLRGALAASLALAALLLARLPDVLDGVQEPEGLTESGEESHLRPAQFSKTGSPTGVDHMTQTIA